MRNEPRIVLPSGKQVTLRGLDVVDEPKFNALPENVFLGIGTAWTISPARRRRAD
jgi:hypothetical protein